MISLNIYSVGLHRWIPRASYTPAWHALEQDVAAGIEHVCDEVLLAFAETGGVQGVVARRQATRTAGHRHGLGQRGAVPGRYGPRARSTAKDPDRRRPAPISVQRFEVYGSVPELS